MLLLLLYRELHLKQLYLPIFFLQPLKFSFVFPVVSGSKLCYIILEMFVVVFFKSQKVASGYCDIEICTIRIKKT